MNADPSLTKERGTGGFQFDSNGEDQEYRRENQNAYAGENDINKALEEFLIHLSNLLCIGMVYGNKIVVKSNDMYFYII